MQLRKALALHWSPALTLPVPALPPLPTSSKLKAICPPGMRGELPPLGGGECRRSGGRKPGGGSPKDKQPGRRLSQEDAAAADRDQGGQEGRTQAHGPLTSGIVCVGLRLKGVVWEGGSLWREGHS